MKEVHTLSEIRDERAIQPMIQALKEKQELQADLGYALGMMGELAVEPLIKAPVDKDPEVRIRAAEAFGKIGDKRAVGPLTDALKDQNEGVRTFAKMGLESIENQQKKYSDRNLQKRTGILYRRPEARVAR
jgi:HEAT repeat protein